MKVAVVQYPPVYMDKAKSIERAVELIGEAAGQDSGLIVFPEAWLPGYPTFVWRLSPGADMKKTDELYALSQTNSVDLSKDDLGPVKEAAQEHGIVVVMGHQELDGALSGSTLFNSVAIIDADGRFEAPLGTTVRAASARVRLVRNTVIGSLTLAAVTTNGRYRSCAAA